MPPFVFLGWYFQKDLSDLGAQVQLTFMMIGTITTLTAATLANIAQIELGMSSAKHKNLYSLS